MEPRNVLPRDISEAHSLPFPAGSTTYAHLISFRVVDLIPLESRQSPSERAPWFLGALDSHPFSCCTTARTREGAVHAERAGLGSRPGSGVQRKEDMGQMDWLQVGTLQHHSLGRQ